MGPVVFAGLTEAGIITWRDFKNGRTILGLPVPGDYLAVFIVFGGIFLITIGVGALVMKELRTVSY